MRQRLRVILVALLFSLSGVFVAAQPSSNTLFIPMLRAPGTLSVKGDPIEIPPPAPQAVAVASGRWSAPTTWTNNQIPQHGQVVQIPQGINVILDIDSANLGGLYIEGGLSFLDQGPLTLTSEFVLAHMGGVLAIGSEAAPFVNQATIVLTGAPTRNSIMGMGSKFLGAMHGGSLRLHSASREKRSWTKLNAHALPGDTLLTLAEPVNWQPGDQIVLAPTGFDPAEAEQLEVVAVDGNRVTVTPALRFAHFGELQSYAGRSLDQRAAVGLLSRNLVITSAGVNPASEQTIDRFGGHVMVMAGSSAFIEGVEFRQLGQETRLGRYAFHWHIAGDVRGQYVRNSSVNLSFTRGIVVHSSDNALVADNVGYRSHSHMFIFAEAGDEVGNRFERNLSVLTERLPEERRIFENDESDPNDRTSRKQDEHRPSSFWGLNMHNTLIGNIAAGSYGAGFFYDEPGNPDGAEFVFRDNTAHSHYSNTGGNDRYPPLTRGYGLFLGTRHPEGAGDYRFENFTAFKNSIGGVWMDHPSHVLQGALLADNGSGALLSASRIEDSVIIGQSANTNGEPQTLGDGYRNSGISMATNQGPNKQFTVTRTTFIDLLGPVVASSSRVLDIRSNFSQITLINSPIPFGFRQARMQGGIHDLDGSLLGVAGGRMVVGRSPLLGDASCELRSDLGGQICSTDHVLAPFRLSFEGSEADEPLMITRDDGISAPIGSEDEDRNGYVLARRTYHADLASGRVPAVIQVAPGLTRFAESGLLAEQWLVLGLPISNDTVFAYFEDLETRDDQPNLSAPLLVAASIDDVRNSAGDRYFVDRNANRVYIKIIGANAPMRIYFCTNTTCSE